MGLIREPKNVDFTVQSIPWTEDELRDFRVLMKKLKAKNDIDFIVGQGALTKVEEQALSQYSRSKKPKQTSARSRSKTSSQ